jgi:hypothetical protein
MSIGSIAEGLSNLGEERRNKLAALFVVVIAFFVYANSLGNGFVWDDADVIVTNPVLRGSPVSLFKSIDTTRDNETLPYYRPLTILTFLVEERLHGLMPFPMHLINVLLHAVTAFLVYLLVQSLGSDIKTSFLAGVLFAVHPINTEVVDFISARNGLLSGFFILLAFLIHHRSVMRKNISGGFLAAFFLLAGLFSKETALVALPFIIAQEFFAIKTNISRSRFQAAMRLLPYAAVLSCYLIMRWMTLSRFGIQTSIIPGMGAEKLQSIYKIPDLWERLVFNFYIIPRYIITFIWPVALSVRYSIPTNFQPFIISLTFAWICIAAIMGWLFTRGRSRTTLFGLAWFALFYVPISGIVMFPSSPMADRYMYVPAIGLWIVIADQARRFLLNGALPRKYGFIVAALILLALGGLTVRRNMDWKNEITLFSRFVEQYQGDAYSHLGLGNAYFAERNQGSQYLDLAEAEYKQALALNPVLPGVYTNMGYILLARGDAEGAVRYYTTALGIYPLDKEALLNRGIALELLGRPQEAVADFRRFLSITGYELAEARPYAEARIRELSR